MKEDIIVGPAEGIELPKGADPTKLWRLKRTVYGLRQSNKGWVDLVKEFLIRQGYKNDKHDNNFYSKVIEGRKILCLVYMDDILIAAHKNKDIDNLSIEMNKEWKVKDLGSISRYLRMRFTQDSKFIYIDQAPYLENLLMSSGMGECHPLKIPIKDLPLPKELGASALLSEKDKKIYKSLVGSLLWVHVCTRPDLQYAVSKLGSKMTAPSIRDMEILKKCLRYVRGTINAKIAFKKNTDKYVGLVGCSDASHGSESKRYSQDDYVFMWNGTPVT